MASNHGIRLGVTLYSLTNEFHDRKYDLAGLIARVAELKLGPGIEIVGFQSVCGFPAVSDAFAREFRDLLDRHELTPSCLGINADVDIRRGQPMSEDESYEYHVAQIEAARKLGFPVVRAQYPAGPAVIGRLAPYLEKVGIKLGIELHAPHAVDSPDILAYRELYDRLDSPFLGFVPDFGASARTVPPSFVKAFRDSGLSGPLIDLALEVWRGPGDREARVGEFDRRARAAGYSEYDIVQLYMIFGLFGRQDPKAWLELTPRIVHIHGKFFDFDEAGDEVAIAYKQILPLLQQAGVDCFMSSEWEGHMWSETDGFEMLLAHRRLCRGLLAEA